MLTGTTATRQVLGGTSMLILPPSAATRSICRCLSSFTFLLLLFTTISINGSSVVTSISAQQPSTYRLVSTGGSSFAQYLPWHPCLNGTLIFEFRTSESNGLLMYAQSLPYKYIQLSLVDGLLRLRMRIGEKDNPRGIFLVYQTKKLSDNKWHEVQLLRMNERTVLVVDGESLHHVHKEASLDGTDLYFGDSSAYHDMMLMLNGNGGSSNGGGSSGGGGVGSATTSTSFASIFFMGGLPSTIQTFDLSLGTALFEPRFSGQFRNVRALNCSSPFLMRLKVIASSGLQYGPVDQDACMSSPCLNSGVCSLVDGDETGGSFHQNTHQLYYSYQSGQQYDDYEQQAKQGFECDCTFTNYEGRLCEKLKPPQTKAELTFSGKEFFSFDLPGSTTTTTAANHPTYEEEYFMEFKTSRSTGLLAYSGDAQDYFVFGLLDGGLYFKLNMRGQLFERTLALPGTFLHNNLWHSVKFTRRLKQIEIMIDNVKKESSGFTGEFIATQTRTIYIGGVPKQNIIYRTIRKNFIGCLRNVTFKTDVSTTPLNLVEMALNNSVLVTKHGSIETSCRRLMDPITFSSPNTYIPVYTWKDFPKLYSFSIEFQTTENYGLLAYILGPEVKKQHKRQPSASSSRVGSLNRDFFALEIHNRFLNAYFNLGGSSTYIRHEVVHEHVSSGKSHQIHVELNDKYAVFRFDQKPETSIRLDTSPYGNETLELAGPLVIGGLYPNHTTGSDPFASPSQKIPPYFYSGMLGGHGYVGCIQDVEINGQYVNLTKYAAQEGVSGVNTDVCTPMPNQCDIGHCMNDGVCMEGWNRFYCDCSATGFNGPICNQPATTAHFASGQHIRIQFEPQWNSEAEHLSLRFKTEKKHNSILLSTYSSNNRDHVEISLDETRVKLSLKIGTNDINMYSEDELCDNEWHTLKVMREGPRIILQVDNDVPSTGMLGELNSTRDVQLKFSYLEIGASLYTDREYFLDPETSHVLSYSTIDMGSKFSKHKNSPYTQRNLNSFQGDMQQLVINGRSYFELIANDDLSAYVNKTVEFSRLDLPHKYPISFNNHMSGFELPKIDSSHILLIQFHFKTTDESGLILFNKGHASDFLAVELHQGQVHYVFGVGAHSGEPMRIRSRARTKLNDNKWHLVSIWRSTRANHELTVDSLVYKYTSEQKDGGGAFKLVDKLYVGGLKNQSMYGELGSKKMIASKYGYKGCLASIEINGHMPDLEYILNSKTKSHGNVSKGCENAYDCTADACKHGGVCVEKWDENRRVCNCESTTYTGKFCERRSKGYSINKASILFNYKSPFYWQEDTLTFGFETKNVDVLLFRAFSSRVNKTLQIELIDGHLQAVFTDLHGISHFHQFKNYRLNRNRYHIVKFKVSDFNSSLQVDGINARKDPHSDHTLKIVRKHPPMQKNPDTSLITAELVGSRDFVGKIYGLVYNQYRILDMLAENDRRVASLGELDLIEEFSPSSSEMLISSCQDPSSANYHKEECKQYQTTSSSTAKSPIDDPNRVTKTSSQSTSSSTLPSTPITSTESTSAATGGSVNTESSVSGGDEHHGTNDDHFHKPDYLEKLLNMSTGYLVGFAAAGLFLFLLIVLALYKFFTREEGSYRIDESKNCGPFADLDMPLNGGSGGSGGGGGSHGHSGKKKREQLVKANKEWFV